MPAFQPGARYWGHTSLTISGATYQPFTGLTGVNIITLTHTASAVRVRIDGVTAHSGTGLMLGPNATGMLTFMGATLISGMSFAVTGPTGTVEVSYGNVE